jgi:hypothetical protein
MYGQPYPPKVDLSKIKGIPTVMIVGYNDELADYNDARWLLD